MPGPAPLLCGIRKAFRRPRSSRARHTEMRSVFATEGRRQIAPIDPKVSAAPWSNKFIFSLVSSRAAHQPLPTRGQRETKMHNSPEYLRKSAAKRCAICNGRFGLIRHYSWRTALCSKKCVDRFKARQKDDLRWYGASRMPAKQLQ